MENPNLEEASTDAWLQACLVNFQGVVLSKGCPSEVKRTFRESLHKVVGEALPSSNLVEQSIVSSTMMLEELARASSKVIVTIAAVYPCALRNAGKISGEQEKLLRRGMEDAVAQVVRETLEAHILSSHVDFSEFQESRR